MAAEFAAKRIPIALRVAAKDGFRGDAEIVSRALNNLLDKVLKHTPDGGSVAVEVADQGTGARFAVSNSGPGIATEDLPFIFERFYRGEKSRARDRGGAGIGLAIVREVASAHAGEVGAKSDGERTIVWFTIGTALPNPDKRLT